MKTREGIELPDSKLTKSQVRTYGPKLIEGGRRRITVKVRFDDQCGNGHNSFAITADIDRKNRFDAWEDDCGGCCHDEVAKHFPELAPFIKWHLTSSDGPMHYLANTLYLAGERDFNGLLKGEFRHFKSHGPTQNNGVEGVPNWVLEFPKDIPTDVYSHTKPTPVTVEWKPYGRTGEGKVRELDAARHCAVWPDATDAELCAENLRERLLARLPGLMAEFKSDMEKLGFAY